MTKTQTLHSDSTRNQYQHLLHSLARQAGEKLGGAHAVERAARRSRTSALPLVHVNQHVAGLGERRLCQCHDNAGTMQAAAHQKASREVADLCSCLVDLPAHGARGARAGATRRASRRARAPPRRPPAASRRCLRRSRRPFATRARQRAAALGHAGGLAAAAAERRGFRALWRRRRRRTRNAAGSGPGRSAKSCLANQKTSTCALFRAQQLRGPAQRHPRHAALTSCARGEAGAERRGGFRARNAVNAKSATPPAHLDMSRDGSKKMGALGMQCARGSRQNGGGVRR